MDIEDLKRRLIDLRCSGKLPLLEDIETINDAILAVEELEKLKKFGVKSIE